eukprot:15361663-Ditylum_brightwellii.AAC.1
MHVDSRDLGRGSILLRCMSRIGARIENVNCCHEYLDFHHIVHAVSYKVNGNEAYAMIGSEPGDPTCMVETSVYIDNNEIQLYSYVLDLPAWHHCNPTTMLELHQDIWDIFFTSCAIVYRAT